MKYHDLVIVFIIILNLKLVYCGYIGSKNQKNIGNKRLATSYHNKVYIHTGSKLEPPSRPSFNWDDSQYKPYFDEILPRNITSQLGKSAYLHCAIRELGDRTVSWVRQRDLHILTVGSYTYTSDQRFSCVNREETGTWTLEIKYVRKEDQGVYECQVSTEPKLSYSVWLNVQAAKAIIPEGPVIQLAQKSQLKLTCLLDSNYQTQSNPPSFVFWYKDGAVINYLTGRSELRIISNFIDGRNFYNKTFISPVNKNLFSSSFFTNNYQTSSLLLKNKLFPSLDHSRLNSKKENYINYMNFVQKQDSENKDEFFIDKENDEKLIFDQDDNHLKEKVDKKIILSVLTIDSVRLTDSGQYSCKPSYADFANVTVQIFKDDIVRSKSLFDLNHQQANNIYSANNNEEDTKSIEFFDDEESFYIMRRSPSQNLSSNASSSLLSSLIWFDLILFKNMYCISKILMLFIVILKIFLT